MTPLVISVNFFTFAYTVLQQFRGDNKGFMKLEIFWFRCLESALKVLELSKS